MDDRARLAVYIDWLDEQSGFAHALRDYLRDYVRWLDWRDAWRPALDALRAECDRVGTPHMRRRLDQLEGPPGRFSRQSLRQRTWRRWLASHGDQRVATELRADLVRWLPSRPGVRGRGPLDATWLMDLDKLRGLATRHRLGESVRALGKTIELQTGCRYELELLRLATRRGTFAVPRVFWVASLGRKWELMPPDDAGYARSALLHDDTPLRILQGFRGCLEAAVALESHVPGVLEQVLVWRAAPGQPAASLRTQGVLRQLAEGAEPALAATLERVADQL